MSILKIRRDRKSYAAPVVKLCVSLAVVLAVKAGEIVVNANFDGRYDMPARVVFCVVAAVGAILCYQALMEIGFVYDNRHPNAAASVGSAQMSVDDVMEAVAGDNYSHAAILVGDDTLVVGTRAKNAANEDFTRVFFANEKELTDEGALRDTLLAAAKDGMLTVAAVGDLTGKKYARSLEKGNRE